MKHHRKLIDLKTQKKPSFILFGLSAMVATFCGSQFVHLIYKPLNDWEQLIDQEYAKLVDKNSKRIDDKLVNEK